MEITGKMTIEVTLSDRLFALMQSFTLPQTPEPDAVPKELPAPTRPKAKVSAKQEPTADKPEAAPVEQQATEAPKTAPRSLEEIRKLAAELAGKGRREDIKALLAEYGAATAPELTPDQRDAFYTRLEAM